MNGISWYSGRRVCVTGATGLVGSHVVRALVEAGAHVRAIVHDRARNDYTRMAQQVLGFDLLYPNEARAAVRSMDTVIACAGVTGGVGLAQSDPTSFVGPATILAAQTLHAAHIEGVKHFGHVSSTTVYAASDEPVREDDIGPAPYAGYAGVGEAKRWLEKLCRYYHDKTGMAVAVVRPSGVYGRYDRFDEKTSHVIPGMIARALRIGRRHDFSKHQQCPDCLNTGWSAGRVGEKPCPSCDWGKKPHPEGQIQGIGPPPKEWASIASSATFEVWGDGEDVRDFVHASDVAAGLLAAVANVSDADPINIASGAALTTRQLAETVLTAVESGAEIVTRPDKPTAMRVRRVDISKAKRVLGWEPRVMLADGLADTVRWMRGA